MRFQYQSNFGRLLRVVTITGFAFLLIALPMSHRAEAAAATDATEGDRANSADEPVTEFVIEDGATCKSIQTGDVTLGGILKLEFDGRILPHENTEVTLYGGGDLSAIHGKFDRVEVENDWLCDIDYDYKKPAVVAKNFRPRRPPAFPGAEGFGKFAVGGRGGKVIAVTNLNDDGPGSFRAACMVQEPRIVVFRVSGTIHLKSKLEIESPYITIAGQTAPGDGICIADQMVDMDANHAVVRYVRFRPGDIAGKIHDGFGGAGSNFVIDHCSVSWGIDETLSINKGRNFTVQWSMITESLCDSIHKKGKHGYGGLWGGPGGSWHHNLLAHHTSRNPRASGNVESGLMDCRNNVIYNWGFNSAYGGELWPRNWVNNYYKAGPATERKVRHRIFQQLDSQGRMYADGNFVTGSPEISNNNWEGIVYDEEKGASEDTLRVDTPFVVAPVRTQSAEEAFELVIANAGASKSRDIVDKRIAKEATTGTAQFGATWRGGGKGIIDSQKDVGGWPKLATAPAPKDSDNDGMPDDWETAHKLNPNDESDGKLDADNDGYTNVEEYLNSLAPSVYAHAKHG